MWLLSRARFLRILLREPLSASPPWWKIYQSHRQPALCLKSCASTSRLAQYLQYSLILELRWPRTRLVRRRLDWCCCSARFGQVVGRRETSRCPISLWCPAIVSAIVPRKSLQKSAPMNHSRHERGYDALRRTQAKSASECRRIVS